MRCRARLGLKADRRVRGPQSVVHCQYRLQALAAAGYGLPTTDSRSYRT